MANSRRKFEEEIGERIRSVLAVLGQKANVEALEAKMDADKMQEIRLMVAGKVESSDLRREVSEVKAMLPQGWVSKAEVDEMINRVESQLTELANQKIELEEIEPFIESKIEKDELERTRSELVNRFGLQQEIQDQQQSLIELLCQETCIARFLWKSGTHVNKRVPWEVQVVNTCPENFNFTRSQPQI